MILQILYSLLYIVLTLLFSWLPDGSFLPWGTDPIFIEAVSYFRAFMIIFWPLEIVLEVFLVYLLFLLAMKILKFFVGHRAPVTD